MTELIMKHDYIEIFFGTSEIQKNKKKQFQKFNIKGIQQ